MSIDTIRGAFLKVPKVDITKFDDEHITISKDEDGKMIERKKFTTRGKDGEGVIPRLTYYPENQNLIFEVSLPKMLKGTNGFLLDQGEVTEGLIKVCDFVEKFGDIEDCKTSVSRIDCVWSWSVGSDLQAYINILKDLPVTSYKRIPYHIEGNKIEGMSWVNKTRKINVYDKGQETKDSRFDGVLRMEVQNKSQESVKSFAERYDLDDRSLMQVVNVNKAKKEVSNWLKRLNMPAEIKTEVDIFDEVSNMEELKAQAAWFFVSAYWRYGEKLADMPYYSEATFRRNKAILKKKGLLVRSKEKTLKGLEVQ